MFSGLEVRVPFCDYRLVEYGDIIQAGLTEMILMPISAEEKNNNTAMRRLDTHFMTAGPSKIFCKEFRLKYKRLSHEERSLLKKLFKKSPLIKQSGMNFRRRPWK